MLGLARSIFRIKQTRLDSNEKLQNFCKHQCNFVQVWCFGSTFWVWHPWWDGGRWLTAAPTEETSPKPKNTKYAITHCVVCQSSAFQTQSRPCVPECRVWTGWWRTSTTWPSPGRATPRCPTSSRWCCPCCATTCPTGGSGGPRTSRPAGAACAAPPSPPSTSASSSATSSRYSTTTWASTRPPGWRGLQVGSEGAKRERQPERLIDYLG